jgi:hypothetical protein
MRITKPSTLTKENSKNSLEASGEFLLWISFLAPSAYNIGMSFTDVTVSLANISRTLSSPTWDLILIFVLVGGTLFWAFLAGRRKIVSAIMLTYVALAIFPAIPVERIIGMIGFRDQALGSMGIFIILLVLIVWLLGARRGRAFSPGGPWWQVALLSFVQAGLLVHIVLSFLPSEGIASLSPLTRQVFTDPDLHIWWLVVPAALLVIIRRFEMHGE